MRAKQLRRWRAAGVWLPLRQELRQVWGLLRECLHRVWRLRGRGANEGAARRRVADKGAGAHQGAAGLGGAHRRAISTAAKSE